MVTVTRSTVIDAPIDEVWGILRDFNGHDRWHPAVAESRVEDGLPPDVVGCVRDFRLADGGRIREQLLSLSDKTCSFTYCILEAPVPLVNYVATVRLRPVTDGARTLWQWEGRFRSSPGRTRELTELVGEQIYQAGFEAVRRLLAERIAPDQASAPERPPELEPPAPLGRTPVDTGPRPAAGEQLRGTAMVATEYGGPDVFAAQETAAPPPDRGQVRLRHTRIGLNFIDIYCRSGYFQLAPPPAVLGMEAAGVVVDVGEGVHHLHPGDRVAYACPPPGAYCDVRTMDAALVIPLPDAVSDDMAGAAMLKGLSAEFLLHRVHAVQPGETVLVHAAAGGVGSLLCQWAALKGATVIGTVGSREKAERAREFGLRHVVVYTEESFVERVHAITEGRGADVVYDAVGKATLDRSYEALATRGHLVSYGQASGHIEPVDIAAYASKSATISRPNFAHYVSDTETVRTMTERLFPLLANGRLRVDIGHRFPLSEVGEAHRLLESRGTVGATVLIP
ncbi:MAG: zinc-binding dehydrogenase [Ectothiorhodospiraceae bacterium]|nr:zinc-binding dehydrogenase [Ectothiorhodospiraceae bacterium]